MVIIDAVENLVDGMSTYETRKLISENATPTLNRPPVFTARYVLRKNAEFYARLRKRQSVRLVGEFGIVRLDGQPLRVVFVDN